MTTKFPLLLGGIAALTLLAGCGSSTPEQPAADTAAVGTSSTAATQAPAEASAPAEVVTVSVEGMTGSSDKGEKQFNQCRACHSVKEGENRVGPSLHAIIGEKAAEVPNFKFSKAMQESGITWTEDKLYEYLEDPQKMVPGTTMIFPGIKDPQKRADVVAYIKAN